MNKCIKSFVTLSFLVSSIFGLAHAGSDYNQNDLDQLIEDVQTEVGAEACSVEKIVFAIGIQSYIFDGVWTGTGPLAALYTANNGNIGTLKIGTHYQHLSKPAWEFPEGRVIVDVATKIENDPLEAGPLDVAWLDVDLDDPDDLGYDKLFRINTVSGVPPNNVIAYETGATIGIGYTTFYVFLSCS